MSNIGLDYNEIPDGDKFEDLICSYFREFSKSEAADRSSRIIKLDVLKSGIGTDGGTDIILDFEMTDELSTFHRVWVVQCKFHEKNVGPAAIQTVNIPTLVHSHNADGYLLICKSGVTSGVTDLFNRLEKKCTQNFKYIWWDGERLKEELLLHRNVIRQFFPNYWSKNKENFNQ